MATGLRERKKQQLRQTILETAVGLFRERGFDETRVQDIIERAEISLGTFYNYFPGKDAVLDEFGRNLIASYVQLAAEELALEDQTVDERVRALAQACGRAFSSDPEFMIVVVTRSRAFGGRGQLPTRDDPIYALLSQLFAEGQANGDIRRDVPPVELAENFSGVFMFTVVSWLAEWRASDRTGRHDQAALDARLMRSFDVFLDGCSTHDAPGQR
jgi:AcrR family transcriptional regulator